MKKDKNKKIIVSSMSYEDVAKFLIDDFYETYDRILNKRDYNFNQSVRKAKASFSGSYPYHYKMFDMNSANGLPYMVMGMVVSEKAKKNGGGPFVITKFSYKGISHYAIISYNFYPDFLDKKSVWSVDIFHPHVLHRYYERIHDEYAESDMENFLTFFEETGGLTKLMTTPTAKYDHPQHGETMYKVVGNGILLGNHLMYDKTNVYIYKTFLSEDILKDSQSDLHEVMNLISDITVDHVNAMASPENAGKLVDHIMNYVTPESKLNVSIVNLLSDKEQDDLLKDIKI